jgi:hypothetical protein
MIRQDGILVAKRVPKPTKARIEASEVKQEMTELLLRYGTLPPFKKNRELEPEYAAANLKTKMWLIGGYAASECLQAVWRSKTGLKQSLSLTRRAYTGREGHYRVHLHDGLCGGPSKAAGLPMCFVVCRRDLDGTITWMPIDAFCDREA